jgi:hypothetical protein
MGMPCCTVRLRAYAFCIYRIYIFCGVDDDSFRAEPKEVSPEGECEYIEVVICSADSLALLPIGVYRVAMPRDWLATRLGVYSAIGPPQHVITVAAWLKVHSKRRAITLLFAW